MRDFIFQAAANPRLKDLHRILIGLLRIPVAVTIPLECNACVRELNQILLALEMRNADMAGLVTRRYLRHRFGPLRATAQDKPARRLRGAKAVNRARRAKPISGAGKASTAQRHHQAEP